MSGMFQLPWGSYSTITDVTLPRTGTNLVSRNVEANPSYFKDVVNLSQAEAGASLDDWDMSLSA